ncbi:MAG: translation elongation factor Ts [Flammeovirgaceae bacterium]
MSITAADVNKLRKQTGAGMMDCKKALAEAEGDMQKAIDILRKKGQKVSAKRADRDAAEGVVFVHTNQDATEGIAFALNCETDFVAKNEEFVGLGQSILDAAISNKPANVDALVGLEVEGRKISDLIMDFTGKIGEKIEVSSYVRQEGEQVVSYKHGDKIGVLVNLANTNGTDVTEAGKNVGMQIASMRPVAVDESGVDADLVEREKQIGIEKARQEGKPEHILDKIANGFVKKFYKDNTLLNQEYVKDSKQTVKQYLNGVSNGLTVKDFARLSIGR